MLNDPKIQAAAKAIHGQFPSLGIAWRMAIDPAFRAEVYRAVRLEQAIARLRAVTGWDEETATRRATWYARTESLTVTEATDELTDRIIAGETLTFEDTDAQ